MTKDFSVLKMLSVILFVSCADKHVNDNEICRDPAIPETYVKMYRDSTYVDSLITLVPLTKSDTLQFISLNWDDSTETDLQRKIFQTDKVSSKTKYKNRVVKFWFTRLTGKSDTTKDFGLFSVLPDDKAIENCRFRFNSKNDITGVNINPFLNRTFVPLDKWTADTIRRDE
jgi:hypothetical protein